MSDPLEQQKPVPTKPTPSGAIDKSDLMLYSAGGGVVVGTQLFSKTYPHLAAETFTNVIGGAHLNVSKLRESYVHRSIGLFPLPAPIGYMDPVNYDLPPNWLAGVNYNLQQRLQPYGLPKWFGLPESSILKTQPDTHPDVIAGNYRLQGLQQIRRVREFAVRATTDEVLDLYRFANSPEGQQRLFFPAEVIEDLGITVRARVGIQKGNELLHANSNATALGILGPPPAAPPLPPQEDAIHHIVGELMKRPNSYVTLRAVLDVLGLDPAPRQHGPSAPAPNVGLDPGQVQPQPLTPPTNTLQQEAAKRAPELMRNLVSERADP